MADYNTFEECDQLIAHGSMEAFEKAFPSKKSLKNLRLGEHGLSLLHLAAWHNRLDVCEYLINKGIDPDIKESYSGKTPLHIASYLGHLDCVRNLIINGAEPLFTKKSVDALGCHPIHYAAMNGDREMIDFFLKVPNFEEGKSSKKLCSVRTLSRLGNILDILIRKKNYDLLDYYASIGGPHAVESNPRVFSSLYVGYSNEYQWTPFHFAAAMGDTEAIHILLKHFPHASCLNEAFQRKYKFSPGKVALAEGHSEIAHLLGYEKEITSLREEMQVYSLDGKGESDYMLDLAKAIVLRDQRSIDTLLQQYGSKILTKRCFNGDSSYWEKSKINAYSIACRTFAFSFLNGLVEKGTNIPQNEFFWEPRDIVEIPFFNWCLMDVNPYGEGFFRSLKSSLPLSKSA